MIDQLAAGLVGQSLDGRYRLKRVLGSGGFGCVMLADHLLGRKVLSEVAVKLVPRARQRLSLQVEELQRAVQLNHPNLVRCYSAGDGTLTVGSQPLAVLYVVMECASGTLRDRLRSGLLGARDAQQLGADVAEALAYLSSRGIVHRDVKPSNILAVDGVWKLSDLGIARELEHGVTVESAPAGSWPYMPPESHDRVVSPTWDVWALGVTLMEALTKQLPFTVGSIGEWMAQIRSADPQIPLGIPEPLSHVISRCLSRDRSRRPTAAALAEMLRATPAQTPVGRDVIVVAETGEQFNSLSSAVNAAQPWSRIVLRPGRYRGGALIDKPLEIVGDGAPADVIIDGGDRAAVVIAGGEVTLRGLSLRMAGPAARGVRGVVEVQSGFCLFDLCEISSAAADCVYCAGKRSRPVFRRSRLIGGKQHGLVFATDAEGVVDGCEIVASPRSAIVISDRANPVIRHTTVTDAGYRALMVSENGSGVIEDSVLSGGKGPAVEVAKGSTTIFRRVHLMATNGPAVLAASGAKATFVACEPTSATGSAWQLTRGHQVTRI